MLKTCVLGAGIAGLNAAYVLAKAGVPVDVYERAAVPGGLASSFDFGGIGIERFYHFICRTDEDLFVRARDMGVLDKIRWTATETGMYHQKRYYPLSRPWHILSLTPVPWKDRLRFAWHVRHCQALKRYDHLEHLTAKDWLVASVGQRVYDVIWEPLLKIKFGRYHGDVSASWMWHRIHRVANSRRHPLEGEQFGYFEEGSDTLMHALHLSLQQQKVPLHYGCEIRSLTKKGNTFVLTLSSGEERAYDKVVSTLPLSLLAKLVVTDNQSFLKQIHHFEYIGVVCMILKMRRSISPAYWLNVHDKDISFNGIIEYSRLNDHSLRAQNCHIAYIPYYTDVREPRYRMSDEALLEDYLPAIRKIQPEFQKNDIIDYRVFREERAQAICRTHFDRTKMPTTAHLGGLYISDSTQLYPEDRTLSGMIRVSNAVAQQLVADVG